jgi:hypothetical protein
LLTFSLQSTHAASRSTPRACIIPLLELALISLQFPQRRRNSQRREELQRLSQAQQDQLHVLALSLLAIYFTKFPKLTKLPHAHTVTV